MQQNLFLVESCTEVKLNTEGSILQTRHDNTIDRPADRIQPAGIHPRVSPYRRLDNGSAFVPEASAKPMDSTDSRSCHDLKDLQWPHAMEATASCKKFYRNNELDCKGMNLMVKVLPTFCILYIFLHNRSSGAV